MSGRRFGVAAYMGPVCVALGALGVIASAYATSIIGQANVTVVLPFTITVVAELRFGVIDGVVGRTGSNVTLVSSIFQQAVFKVTGDAFALFDITLPPNNTIELTSGANTMTIETFTSSPSGSGQILFTGFSFVSVGATLTIGANQPAGTYTGTFDVTVDYQPIP